MERRSHVDDSAASSAREDDSIPLRDYIGTQMDGLRLLIEALDKLTDAKFVTFRTLVDSQAEKVALALTAADKAVLKAELATEKRFESVNEFRGQLADQAATLASRREMETMQLAINLRLDNLSERLTETTRRIDTSEGKSSGISSGFGVLIATIGTIVALVSIFIAFSR